MAGLKQEISQQRPFSSLEEEALLNVLRTSDCLQRTFQRRTKDWGITSTQYNVLRILRGSQPQGLTCSAIGERMIAADPDITRLLARMRAIRLIKQQRDRHDRRVLWTHISSAGLELLQKMDPEIQAAPKELLGHLRQADLTELIRLLEVARRNCQETPASVDCNGKEDADHDGCGLKPTLSSSNKDAANKVSRRRIE